MLPVHCLPVICQGCPCKKCVCVWLSVWGHADHNEASAGTDRNRKVEVRFFSEKCAVKDFFQLFMFIFCAWLLQKDCIFTSLLCFIRCVQQVTSHTMCTRVTQQTPRGRYPWLWECAASLERTALRSTPIWVKAPKKLAEVPSGPDPPPMRGKSVEKVSLEKRSEKKDHL